LTGQIAELSFGVTKENGGWSVFVPQIDFRGSSGSQLNWLQLEKVVGRAQFTLNVGNNDYVLWVLDAIVITEHI
jgi:hypothetical protein